jgi:membrane-anchored glycerophosphoryl diester phosphodiesterase (GDPDase)
MLVVGVVMLNILELIMKLCLIIQQFLGHMHEDKSKNITMSVTSQDLIWHVYWFAKVS